MTVKHLFINLGSRTNLPLQNVSFLFFYPYIELNKYNFRNELMSITEKSKHKLRFGWLNRNSNLPCG